MAVNLIVEKKFENEDDIILIKRFLKKVKKEKILQEAMEKQRYKKPSDKKRERRNKRKRTLKYLRKIRDLK